MFGLDGFEKLTPGSSDGAEEGVSGNHATLDVEC